MPAVIDFNNVAMSVLVQDLIVNRADNERYGIGISEDLVRHLVFNTIKSHIVKNRMHGEMVIACDGGSWRKRFFAEYKANRKVEVPEILVGGDEESDEPTIDFTMIYEVLDEVRTALKTHFPIKVVHINEVEADDVIAVMAFDAKKNNDSLHIISADKDFKQLHGDTLTWRVTQYSPTQKKDVEVDDPNIFLCEHILAGDGTDGIPKLVHPDNYYLLTKEEQVELKCVISAKMKSEWKTYWDGDKISDQFFNDYEAGKVWKTVGSRGKVKADQLRHAYKRNDMMVNLNRIPSQVQDFIRQKLAEPVTGDIINVVRYFHSMKLAKLAEQATDFA